MIDSALFASALGALTPILLAALAGALCQRAGVYNISLEGTMLVGAFAGVVELIPVIGPLAAGALAVAVGLTVSWQTAALAAFIVFIVRMIEDYLVIPRVLGEAVGLTPLTVLVSVSAVAILFGGFAVLLAIPLAAVLATLVDVLVRHRDPAQEDVPAVLFPAKDAETGP